MEFRNRHARKDSNGAVPVVIATAMIGIGFPQRGQKRRFVRAEFDQNNNVRVVARNLGGHRGDVLVVIIGVVAQ